MASPFRNKPVYFGNAGRKQTFPAALLWEEVEHRFGLFNFVWSVRIKRQ
jgi:hypothetical protein